VVTAAAGKSGYIIGMETGSIGISTVMLGAGRERKDDAVDPAVGLWMKKRIGDYVEKGEPLAEFHINDTRNEQEAIELFLGAVHIGGEKPEKKPLIAEIIG